MRLGPLNLKELTRHDRARSADFRFPHKACDAALLACRCPAREKFNLFRVPYQRFRVLASPASSPVGAVERTIADCFSDMRRAYLVAALQVCDSTADLQYPIICPR